MEPEFFGVRNRAEIVVYCTRKSGSGWSHQRGSMNRIGLILVALAMCAGLAHASGTGQGKGVMGRWKAMDICARTAQKAFPDYTAESNAKRDAALKSCLAGANLPPRESVSPALPAAGR
jgi:hypothetical protein